MKHLKLVQRNAVFVHDTFDSLLMSVFRSSFVFSRAAVLALRDGRTTGTFSPSLQQKQKCDVIQYETE